MASRRLADGHNGRPKMDAWWRIVVGVDVGQSTNDVQVAHEKLGSKQWKLAVVRE